MTPPSPPQGNSELIRHFTESLLSTSQFTMNLGGTFITTSEDKIKLAMHAHLSRLSDRKSWVAPLGILVALGVVFPTTTFQDALFPAAIWQDIFVFATGATALWFLWSVYRAWNAPAERDFLDELRVAPSIGPTPPSESSAQPAISKESSGMKRDTFDRVELKLSPSGGSFGNPYNVMESMDDEGGKALAMTLVRGSWTLVFNPAAGGRKPISFLPDGRIGLGRNANESTWGFVGTALAIANASGELHSRFRFNNDIQIWEQEPLSSTPKAINQSIIPRAGAKR